MEAMNDGANNTVAIPDEIAERYTGSDQRERFDAAMGKILSVPSARAEKIRNSVSATETHRGRPAKGKVVPSRVPVVVLPA